MSLTVGNGESRLRMRAGVSYGRLLGAFARHVGRDAADLSLERGRSVVALDEIAAADETLFVRERLPAYVIVLRRDARRVEHVQRRILPLVSSAKTIDAVDGADAPALVSALRRNDVRLSPDYARTATVGQLGCACSHIDVWRRVADALGPTVVLEDDASPVDDFATKLENLLLEARDLEWDWIYLFYHPDCHRHLPIPDKSQVQRAFQTWGTVAYVLAPRGATVLLREARDAAHDGPIDHLVMRLARDGALRTLCATHILAATSGQLNPLHPPHLTPLGSNVWGTPTLLDQQQQKRPKMSSHLHGAQPAAADARA
ncbi:hypothetical protein CTAYLR_006966 [Chrysophaeum taylorii]|uniref:Glycosyl transferase family 25 domain-containing protein n=1 Tax=Chrysophaeum taylorii TaxID=2483200 RepID=A0AAD7UF95_9STRA|nr:hypothetical protein CTAYLR_006966 [Chrysophaeum taylorii]